MLLLFRFLALLPLWLLHGLGAAIGWLVLGLSPTYRLRFLQNAAQAGYAFSAVRAAVAHAGRMVAELPRLWLGVMPHVYWEGEPAIDQAYARGKGVLFLTPHLGGFEAAARAIAERQFPRYGPATILFRPSRQKAFAPVVQASRQRPSMRAVPTTLVGVRQVLKALRSGQGVGLAPDQVPPEGMGLWTPFFGRDAYSVTLAARLAQQTDAAICIVWGERLSWGRGFRIHCKLLDTPLQQDLGAAVLQINQAIESTIRECPQQYLWSYARYKKPRQEL